MMKKTLIIILVLFIALIIPKSGNQYVPGEQLRPQNSLGVGQFDPTKDDWLEIQLDITVDSQTPRLMSFDNGSDPRDVFALGDPVRWKANGGSYEYGYILDMTATQFNVVNTAFDTLITDVITNFSRGVVRKPTGHPVIFTNQATQAAGNLTSSSGTITAGKVGVDWWMDGPIVNAIGTTLGNDNQEITLTSASSLNLNVRMPWLRLNSDFTGSVNMGTYKSSIYTLTHLESGLCYGTTEVVGGDKYNLVVVLQRFGGNFSTGDHGVNFDMKFLPYPL